MKLLGLALAFLAVLAAQAWAVPSPVPWISPTWCATDAGRMVDDDEHAVVDGPDVKLIYAYAADQPNRFLAYADEMQRTAGQMARVVADSHESAKSIRFDLGTACGPSYLDIAVVRLPRTLAEYRADPSATRAGTFGIPPELRVAGAVSASHPDRRYLVWADGMYTGDDNGYGPLPSDDQPGPANANNGGIKFAFFWGTEGALAGCEAMRDCGPFQDIGFGDWLAANVSLHELFHSLGAVSARALHASYGAQGPGHCWDEFDVMCGQSDGVVKLCGTAESDLILDCGADDYFNPAGPVVGRDGAAIWNTYNSAFLCPEATCVGRPLAAATLTALSVKPARRPRVTFVLTGAAPVVLRVQRRGKALKGAQPVSGVAGTNRVRLTRRLRPGRGYRVVALVGDEVVRSAAFRVRRGR